VGILTSVGRRMQVMLSILLPIRHWHGAANDTGAVPALIGAIQYGSGIVGSGLVGIFANGTPGPMGCVIAVCGIGSLLSMRLLFPVTRRIVESRLPVALEVNELNR